MFAQKENTYDIISFLGTYHHYLPSSFWMQYISVHVIYVFWTLFWKGFIEEENEYNISLFGTFCLVYLRYVSIFICHDLI